MNEKKFARLPMIQCGNNEYKGRYREKRINCKQIFRRTKRELVEGKLTQMECTIIRTFYQEVRKQKSGYKDKAVNCKNKKRQLVSRKYNLNRRMECFRELLNDEDEIQEGSGVNKVRCAFL